MPEKTENKTVKKDVQSEVIQALAEAKKPLNMWQIHIQRNLFYASVHKAVETLQKKGQIQQGKPENSKKGGKTTPFRLTFRGFIKYLASHPELRKPIDIVASHGEQLDYTLFKEIHWLTDHYDHRVPQAILEIATIIEDIPLLPVGATRRVKQLKKHKTALKRRKKKLENWKKIGQRIEKEIQETEKELEIFRDHEDKWCRRQFTTLFAQRLQIWRRKENMQNEALYELFKQAAEDLKKFEVTPLEKAAETFKTSTT